VIVGGGQLQSTWTIAANAPRVWQQYGNRGAGVTVAVLDSGVAVSPDLSSELFGVDVVTGTTSLADLGGHGSHVAGIIAGNGTLSGGGYMGIAPDARVLSVKVTTDDGRASYASIIKGLSWVVQNAQIYNIKVANMSLGATVVGSYKENPLDAAVEMAWLRGITVVVSAGNSGPTAQSIAVPGNDPYVVTVGAFDDNGTATSADDVFPEWTSRGPSAYDGMSKIDLVASGRRVMSLRAPGSFLDRLLPERVVAQNYFRLSGTSMAAPVVSGVAALVLAQNPRLTPNQVKYILKQTARPMAGYDAQTAGAGEVDALAAVQLAVQGVGTAQANVGQVPSNSTATGVWRVLKSVQPVWRNKGLWQGRIWVDGSWDGSGFKNPDGTWKDAGWDQVAWSNLSWEQVTWSDAGWDLSGWVDAGWDMAGGGIWDSGGWDTARTVD
jgi:serine protease AprX